MISRKFLAALAITASLAAGAFMVQAAQAQVMDNLNAVGESIALSATDPRIIAARIINVALGFLGIVFLVIILYAGFLWMTAGGDPSKVEKAKKWITNGIIGLLIILSSWAIAYYVINALLNATGGEGGLGGGGTPGGGLGGGGITSTDFFVSGRSPEGALDLPNIEIVVGFSQDVNPANIGQVTISPSVNGSWVTVSPRLYKFKPSDPCPGVPSKFCVALDTDYTVTVPSNFKSANNVQIKCTPFNPCSFKFKSGHNIDAQPPGVEMTTLWDGKNVPVDSSVEVGVHAADENGVSLIKWFEGGDATSFEPQYEASSGNPTPKDFTAVSMWDTMGLIKKQTYTIKATADDVDTNTGEKSVNVVVVAKHCVNKIQDEDEAGKDCGGVDCMACGGSTCTQNTDCSSGLCVNGVCVEQPIITNVSPLSGKAGTYVSIWGGNFGDSGTVTFLGPPAKVAQAPLACVNLGTKTWTDDFALVEVPEGAATGPIRIDNANSKLSDQTDDDRGPKFTYKLTTEEKPGLCAVTPDKGKPGLQISLSGANFGTAKGAVVFGQNVLAQITGATWANGKIDKALVPVVSPGFYSVSVRHANGTSSNPVPFEVESPTAAQPAPTILYITPAKGPQGQYITLVGQRFGNEPNLVMFLDKAVGKEYKGDSLFPNECANGWWRDNNIVIKVPAVDSNVVKPAQFSIRMQRKDGTFSNYVEFSYTDGVPGPGVCSISPASGPVATDVTLSGENLGGPGQGNNVVFYNKINSVTTKDWTSAHVTAKVPSGAMSGGVYLQLGSASSNQMQFMVANCNDKPGICTDGDICCSNGTCSKTCKAQSFTAMYSWQLSTGAVPTAPQVVHYCDVQGVNLPPQGPSPSPSLEWPGGDQVCVNPKPKVGILFNIPIRWPKQGEFDPYKLFNLIKCVGKGADPCEKPEDRVEVIKANLEMKLVGQQPNQMSYVTFEPAGNVEPETVYYVYVTTKVQSADLVYGDFMQEKATCPEKELGDCFKFRTRKDTTTCEVGSFIMNPWEASAEGNTVVQYESIPVPKGNVCSILTCGGLSVDWSTAGQNSNKAAVADANNHTCKNAVLTGNQEAVTPPVDVVAQLTGNANVKGLGSLVVKFILPKVVDKFPNCNSACSNIKMWVQFNTNIKDTSLNDKTVKLYRCDNENCLPQLQDQAHLVPVTVVPGSPLAPQYQNDPSYAKSFWYFKVAPGTFKPGAFYVMRLIGGNPANSVTSQFGVLMPQSTEWKFRIRPTNDVCKPDHVNVIPEKSIKPLIGDRELFTALPVTPADECSPYGQTLDTEEAFGWSIDDTKVAKFVTGEIDADGVLPEGCTDSCKAKGAQGVFGNVARCGNGLVETTDGNYCKNGSTPALQKCAVMAMASGAGEQCDGGGLCGDDCLWKPTATVETPPGTCGDFKIQSTNGEMCDPGYRCFDLPADATTVVDGAPCDSSATIQACTDAKGKCAVREWLGCSPGCKNLGSSSVQNSTCGNLDIALGEDCDQGPDNGKGGCSVNCLHVGSSKNVISICGNGALEPGETCEAPVDINSNPTQMPDWCDAKTCLRKGLSACAKPADKDCCGNGVLDLDALGKTKEDCDDGNLQDGDGCSQICLKEGSSWLYGSPSFCGDGKVGVGEQCEVGRSSDKDPQVGEVTGAGNGKIDGLILAEVLGVGTPDADNVVSTKINAAYAGVTGSATFGVACGHTKESECAFTQNGVVYGLDDSGCCAPRPTMVSSSVKPVGTGVCRNAMIYAEFSTPMNPGSVTGNFVVAKELVNQNSCPDGTKALSVQPEPQGAWQWLAFQWKKFWAWLTGEPTYAIWCTQMVSGTLSPVGTDGKAYTYRLNMSLDANTRYIVRFMGDPNAGTPGDDDKKEGIRTERGVVAVADVGSDPANAANWRYSWFFETGSDICRINSISVTDTDQQHPAFFRKAQEEHLFLARALAIYNGKPQAITQTQEYSWDWLPWVVNDPKIALHKDTVGSQTAIMSQSYIQAVGVNGSAMVFASVTTTVDTIDQNNSTKGMYIEGALPITVFLCDHPWPPLDANGSIAPFRDDLEMVGKGLLAKWLKSTEWDSKGTAAAKQTFLQGLPYFNFQTIYCRDRGEAVAPAMTANLVPSTPVDESLGVLRQYIFVFNDAAYKNDAIGIRVFQNPFHYTPLEWYKAQGFTGTPTNLKVDGFEAVKDTDTVYVGFPNTKGLNENIYQNILVISRNPGSSVVAQNVFDQMVDNMVFNTNFSFDNTNVCVEGGKTGQAGAAPYVSPAEDINEPVVCVSDWDCLKIKPSLRCASFKYKLRHDLQRLSDFKQMGDMLDTYKAQNGYYPKLAQGTFQSARTNSLWPSWADAFAADLGGVKLPIDPVNKFVACGVCQPPDGSTQSATKPCNTDKDCPDKTYKCVMKEIKPGQSFDPATCWSTTNRQFACPYMDNLGQMPATSYDPYGKDEPWAQSRFYRYRALDGGKRYELAANFEYAPPEFSTSTGTTVNWWYPPYPKELQECYTSSTVSNGRICNKDQDCKPCLNPGASTCGAWYPKNSCKPVGYRWAFKNICSNEVTGDSGVCGDGILGGACLDGANKGKSCKADSECPGSTCGATEVCELGQTKLVECDFQGVKDGAKLQVCDDCKGWMDDPNLSVCRAKVACGNGRVDGLCSGGALNGTACTDNVDCKDQDGDHPCQLQEVCDEGNLNGSYGHCAKDCKGIQKFCGNNQLDPGEDCDKGDLNGAWCEDKGGLCYQNQTPTAYDQTCGAGCKAKAPYCGDGIVEGLPNEECDGDVMTTPKALCKGGTSANQICSTNDDCLGGGTCGGGGDPLYQDCAPVNIKACATGAKVCLDANEVNALTNGTFLSNPYINSTYIPCETNVTCSSKKPGSTCTSLNKALNCINDQQCSTASSAPGKPPVAGVCRAYETQHTRKCNAPGSANQCKFESTWSKCEIAHKCGDGVVDPDEECDNGGDNAYWKACLPTCKKNVCGDLYPLLNVEECDNGQWNGLTSKAQCNGNAECEAVVCDPKYGTTCNNCSQQCKFLAKAGGYCGNSIKETGEQCDGNVAVPETAYDPTKYVTAGDILATDSNAQTAKSYVGGVCTNPPCSIMCDSGVGSKQACADLASDTTSLTCEQLGYDFSMNDYLNQAIEVTAPAKVATLVTNDKQPNVTSVNYLTLDPAASSDPYKTAKQAFLSVLFKKCGMATAEVKQGVQTYSWVPVEQWPTKYQFRKCVQLYGWNGVNGFKTVGVANAKPACSVACKPSGCGRCSEEPGGGKIAGYIIDRVWLQAVPGARVTLQYRGVNVDQVMTDENGRYEFSNLNTREECSKYRLVVDKYDDNICTDLDSQRPQGGCLTDITPKFINTELDEGAHGGYWPFTTDEFSVDSFAWQEMFGMVYIYPRPAKGEGYVSYGRPTLIDQENWQKMKDCQQNPSAAECKGFNPFAAWLPWVPQWAPHLVWPSNYARFYPVRGSGLAPLTENVNYSDVFNKTCSYANRGTDAVGESEYKQYVCTRDYNYLNAGNRGDMGAAPYTGAICPRHKWAWDRQGCPMQGTTNCYNDCIAGNGSVRLLNEWVNFDANPTFCNAFCKVGKAGCWTGVSGDGDDYTQYYDGCFDGISSAQATIMFRYGDPKNLNLPLPNLTAPIEAYFAGPEYEPVNGQYYWTSQLTTQQINNWINGTKPTGLANASWQAVFDNPSTPNKAMAWREYLAKTKMKVYVSTDKGIYTVQADPSKTTPDDFKKPFWHLASIGNNGTVTVQNKWHLASEYAPGDTQPETLASYAKSKTAWRPPGMACWNQWGASCKYDGVQVGESWLQEPWKGLCVNGDKNAGTFGILGNTIKEGNPAQYTNKVGVGTMYCANFWNDIFKVSDAKYNFLNNAPFNAEQWNQIAW